MNWYKVWFPFGCPGVERLNRGGDALGNLLSLARRFEAGYVLRKYGRFYVRSSATVNGTPHCVQVTDGKEGSVFKLSLSSVELPFSERVVEGVWVTVTIDENGRDWDTVFGSRAKPLVLAHLSWLREEFRSVVRALPWSPGCTDIANLDDLIRVADLLFLSRVRGFLEVQRSAMAEAAATAPCPPATHTPASRKSAMFKPLLASEGTRNSSRRARAEGDYLPKT